LLNYIKSSLRKVSFVQRNFC